MASLVCPNYNTAEWKLLAEKMGESLLPESQQIKSMKMFMENGDSIERALSKINPAIYSPREKEEKLKALSDRVVFVGTPDPITGAPRHEYHDRSGEILTSVSRKLDENPVLAYRGDDAGLAYSDSGTAVHSVFDQYISGVSAENIRKFASERAVPDSVVSYAISFIDSLRLTGTVLSEVNLRDPSLPVAGRADIIHLKNDGTVDLYDIKTAYRTPHKIVGNKKIWNPLEDYDGYKSQRYSTQLEFYAQMIEKVIGHPVSGQYILPIEVEFKDNVPSEGIQTVSTLEKESTLNYGYTRRATEFVDRALGVKRQAPLPGLPAVDDSSDLVTRLTGIIQNLKPNLDAQAEEMLIPSRGFTKRKGGFLQYRKGNDWVTFRNQTDRVAQKQQIINEYLSQKERSFRDIEPSVKNYIETGKDAFLSLKGDSLMYLRSMLDPYRGLGYTVHSLSDISGFEDKKNWLLISKGEKNDLIYIGSEELSRPFNVTRESSVFAKLAGSDKSLFGNAGFSWNDAKYELGSALRNTIVDAKRVEAAMIVMKLRTAQPTIVFDRILLHSINQNSAVPHHVILTEVLPVLKKLFSHPKGKELIPTTYLSLAARPELFEASTYKQDFAKSYMDLLGDSLNYRDKLILAGVSSYDKDKTASDDVEAAILQRLLDIESTADSSPSSVEQKRLLSEMLYQIRQVPTHAQPVGRYFERWASMPQNVANQVIQDLIVEFRTALSRVRAQFWEGYKKDFNKTVQSLFAASGSPLSRVADYTISNTTKYYEPLLQREEYNTFSTAKDGTQVTRKAMLPNFSLVPEGSDGFNSLSQEQQSAITKFNDTIENASKLMGIEWQRGRIPLVRATFYNKFYRLTKGDEEAYQGLLKRAFDSLEEGFSTGIDDALGKPRTLMNRFQNQANTETSDKRLDMLGISEDKFVQLEKHSEFETNLEVVADSFMMEAIRVHEFNKVNGMFSAANSLFEWQKSRLFDDAIGVNLDWLKVWKDAQLHMKDQDSGTVQSKGVNALNKIASLSLVTKPTVGFIAYLSQQLSVFSQASANSIGTSTDFGVGHWTKAFGIIMNPQNWRKIDLLLDQYGIYNLSMSDLTNGHRRYGNKSVFRLKYLYGILNLGDWGTRGQIMVAQMLKHENWDAYSIVEDKLVYDESKDGRFNGSSLDHAKGRALKEATKRELEQQGITVGDTLPRAYGVSEGNYIKNLSDSIIGGFDRESRALYSFFSLGKFIGLFKTWLPARLNALFDTKFVSKMNGSFHFEKKPDGTYSTVWTGKEMEGILHTLMYMGWYAKKYRENPYQKLTPHQKNNIRIMAVHTAVLATATLALLSMEAGDDDREDPWKKMAATTLQRSLGDIIATYNILALKDFLYTPIAIVFIDRTLSQTWNILSGEKELDRNNLSKIASKIPVSNYLSSFNDIYNLVDQESGK